MPDLHEIRADYDAATIVVYQAYPKPIAEAALKAGTFVAPFSFGRMTWIKPSFLWMMERSNWGLKSGQEHILSVRITRIGWEDALAQAVLTHPEKGVYRDEENWRRQFEQAPVYVQWDPERTLRGAALDYKSNENSPEQAPGYLPEGRPQSRLHGVSSPERAENAKTGNGASTGE